MKSKETLDKINDIIKQYEDKTIQKEVLLNTIGISCSKLFTNLKKHLDNFKTYALANPEIEFNILTDELANIVNYCIQYSNEINDRAYNTLDLVEFLSDYDSATSELVKVFLSENKHDLLTNVILNQIKDLSLVDIIDKE